jgi:hypothetical protein
MYSFNFVTGPTSFAPMIETAIGIVDSTGGQYHVLLIIADGQVGEYMVIFFVSVACYFLSLSGCQQNSFLVEHFGCPSFFHLDKTSARLPEVSIHNLDN